MPESDKRYYWLHCKVCGKVHRGPEEVKELDDLGRQVVPPHGRLECPENLGKFAEYEYMDWRVGTESEVDASQQKPT